VFLIVLIGTFIALLIGILSGLIPGLHINNVIYLISEISISLEVKAIIFIVSSIIFCFLSFIPSTLFSIPNTDNFVATLPSQRFLLKGKAYFAIKLYLLGAINGIIFGLPLIILFLFILQYLTKTIEILTPIILILGLIILFFNCKNYFGYLIILFSGLIGYFAMSFTFVENPLLVIISGLFGVSNILFSLQNKNTIPKQTLETEDIDIKDKIKIGIIGPSLSIFVTLFPGLGNGFATYFGTKISNLKDEGYILLNGAINILVMILSFFTILIIGKARTASAVFFKEFTSNTIIFNFWWVLLFCLIGIIFGYFLSLFLAKVIIKHFDKLNYKKINIFILIFLHIVVLLFSNFLGLIVFWICTIIGYLCLKSENPRILMMACIIFPVLLYFI
jgi:putative membrane protein